MTTTLELAGRRRTTSDVAGPIVPILIQVPSLRGTSRRPGPVRRRRRLRKEVRYAGLTMMSVLPVGFLLLALGGAQPIERPARAASPVTTPAKARAPREAEAVRIASAASLDESPTASAPVPVVFRDYLLPVDGPEEPVLHAGH
jgi:hypothetical protein